MDVGRGGEGGADGHVGQAALHRQGLAHGLDRRPVEAELLGKGAVAPSLKGSRLRRALEGQAVVDASWALANRGDGSFERSFLIGATVPQLSAWILGTAVGAVAGGFLADPQALGLDVIFPAFFLALLAEEFRDRQSIAVAVLGGLIALSLVPFARPGSRWSRPAWPRCSACEAARDPGVADHRPGRAGQLHPQGRRPPGPRRPAARPRATRVVALLAPALLTALVLVDTVTSGQRLVVDARLAGVAAAGAAMLLRAPLLVSLGVAVATTALVRLLSS